MTTSSKTHLPDAESSRAVRERSLTPLPKTLATSYHALRFWMAGQPGCKSCFQEYSLSGEQVKVCTPLPELQPVRATGQAGPGCAPPHPTSPAHPPMPSFVAALWLWDHTRGT